MLDIKKIRENPEYYIAETEKKYTTVSLRDVLAVDNERRPLLTEVERLKSERNAQSKKIGELKKKGENADEAQAATRELGNKIDELDKKLKELDYKQTEMLMHVPNIAPRSPEGKDSSDNVVEKDGPIPFDYYTKNDDFARVDHKTLGERLGTPEGRLRRIHSAVPRYPQHHARHGSAPEVRRRHVPLRQG